MGACCTKPKPVVRYIAAAQHSPLQTTESPFALPNSAPRNSNGPTNDICFNHILEAVYDAALKAQTNVQMNHLHQFFWFFPQNADGSHSARMLRLRVPRNDGEDQDVNVPYFNLIQQSYMTIHEIKLKTKLDMEMTVVPDVSDVHESLPKATYYRIDLVPGDKSTDLELTMRIDPAPEAIQRILHRFDAKL